jgi:cytochrome b561
MPLRNGEHGYGAVTKVLHWLTFAAILGQFLVGYSMSTESSAADAAADRVKDSKEQCEATEDSDAAEAEEERCEEEVDRREDTLDDRADDALGTAWDDLRSGDLLAGGVTLPEWHVLLGLLILALGVARVAWRVAGSLPPWAPALSHVERTLEGWLEKGLMLLLFVIPVSGLLLVAGDDDWVRLHIGAHIAFFVLVGLHVALVLKHTVIQRDRHLARML